MRRYVVLGGLPLNSRAIRCYDWTSLLASAPKRGANRVIPGLPGAEVRPRVVGELRAMLPVRLDGSWQTDGSVTPGGVDGRHEQVYDHLATLRAVTEQTGVLTLELVRPLETLSARCQVEDGGTLAFTESPWIAELVVDITLPDGPLPLGAST